MIGFSFSNFRIDHESINLSLISSIFEELEENGFGSFNSSVQRTNLDSY